MFLSIHFPIADIRNFFEDSGRLDIPSWPLPTPDVEFVRFLGNIRQRTGGGLGGWIGENVICEANRALHFRKNIVFENLLKFRSQKYFYFDGLAVGRFDIGISSLWRYTLHLSENETHNLILQLISQDVLVKNELGKYYPCTFIKAGKRLANIYQFASTKTSSSGIVKPGWVQNGLPQILLEYRDYEGVGIQIPKNYHQTKFSLPKNYGFDLFGCFIPYEGGKIRTWVIRHNSSKSHRREARSLRIYLSRLHAEHESLRLVLRSILQGKFQVVPGSTGSENLQLFLNRTTKHISHKETYLREHDSEIAHIARKSMNILSPGDYDTLINSLELLSMRGNVFKKIVSYSRQWMNDGKIEEAIKLDEDLMNTSLQSAKKPNRMVKILFLSADPTNATKLRLGEEIREIQEKLQLSKLRDSFELSQRFSIRPADISQAMLDVEPNIVHFSGHGMSSGALCFENKIGDVHPVEPDALSALFEQFSQHIDGVILNACYSEVQARAISNHIKYVIGMKQAIPDNAAIAFSVGFYQALGAGRSIEHAYEMGCVQIKLNNFPDELTPVLIKK